MTPNEGVARQRATVDIGRSHRTEFFDCARIMTGPDVPLHNEP
jgi:hypothetical protein